MSTRPMDICLIEPYCTGSHADWLHGLAQSSRHHIRKLILEGQFWQWRMQGGAVTCARLFRARGYRPNLLLATDMLDVTTFLALTRDLTHSTPIALYMHENQLTYPVRPGQKRNLHYALINYSSMLSCNHVFFNSQYHLDSWFDELPRLLKHFPDHNELQTIAELQDQSSVLPIGLNLQALDNHRPDSRRQGLPLIVWNHRWEYDKNPKAFFRALYAMADQGLAFEVALLGERFCSIPTAFEEARSRLGPRLVQFGYASRADYARWLWDADIVVSTATHDFFGVSVVEAMYCGCWPILPNRLSYPQFVPAEQQAKCLYDPSAGPVALLAEAIQAAPERRNKARAWVRQYDWSSLISRYDKELSQLAADH